MEGRAPAPPPPRRPSYKAASQAGTLPRHPTVVCPVPRQRALAMSGAGLQAALIAGLVRWLGCQMLKSWVSKQHCSSTTNFYRLSAWNGVRDQHRESRGGGAGEVVRRSRQQRAWQPWLQKALNPCRARGSLVGPSPRASNQALAARRVTRRTRVSTRAAFANPRQHSARPTRW